MADLKEFLAFMMENVLDERMIAYNKTGAVDDSNVNRVEREIEIYQAGIQCGVPKAWEDDFKQFTNEQDPEYSTYERLKRKFE